MKLNNLSTQNKANVIGWLVIVFSSIAQFVLAPVIKLYMGVAGLGVWHLLFQTFCYLQLVDIGLSNGIVRQIAAAKAMVDDQKLLDVYTTARRGLTVAGLAFAIGGVGACLMVPNFIEIPAHLRREFVMSLALIATWGIFRYRYVLPMLSLRGINRIVQYNMLNLIQGPGRPILGAILLTFELGLLGIASGYVLVEATVRAMASRMEARTKKIGHYNHKYFVKMLTFGSATALISISTLLTFYSSSFIVGWKLGVTAIAVYQSTIALPFLIARFAIVPFTNLLPRFVTYYETGNIIDLTRNGLHTHLVVILAASAVLMVACILNKTFVTLWLGESLFAGHHFTMCYAIFILLTIARHNGYMMYQAMDSLKPLLICHLIEIPVNVALSLILLAQFGLVGIAYAFVIAHFPATIVSQLAFFGRVKRLDNVVSVHPRT